MRKLAILVLAAGIGASVAGAVTLTTQRSLDGSGNNVANEDWGKIGTEYLRVAPANYADGIKKPVLAKIPSRYVSNRIFNDTGQNLFSENATTQWAWVWGQFLDHTFGLRDERELAAEHAPIAWSASDPLEGFTNDFGAIDFFRTPPAPGSGETTPRQQINTVSSYIDAFAVYGGTEGRLDWLRSGPADGDLANNDAELLLPDGYLPRSNVRGPRASAPQMDLMGALVGKPNRAVVAGDVRANENIALTAVHTLFAREHNRIVGELPDTLTEEEKFQIARRVVGAEQQFITYTEFLPALGVTLPDWPGYDPEANATLGNEFAVVGYRAHSMIHGEFEPTVPGDTYTRNQIRQFQKQGIAVEIDPMTEEQTLVIPLVTAFGNPDLVRQVGLGRVLRSLTQEAQYKNDEQIDNSLRSVLFQVPKPGMPDPTVCSSPVIDPECFRGVVDLGAIDIERGRDHGMPFYNELRKAYGLAPKAGFRAITGEATADFPSDPEIDPLNPIDDPDILDVVETLDAEGIEVDPESEDAVTAIRRTTLAARLKAIYKDVNKVDAFTGMVSEKHVAGTEFGELQLAIWRKQFAALRDGDRFFYANEPEHTLLLEIAEEFDIDFRHTLAEVIRANTTADVPDDVFRLEE